MKQSRITDKVYGNIEVTYVVKTIGQGGANLEIPSLRNRRILPKIQKMVRQRRYSRAFGQFKGQAGYIH